MKLKSELYGEVLVYYRSGERPEGSSDEQALEEVLVKKVYRRVRMGFDVFPGERWLDLGANIGAFAVYCRQRWATAECYEPDPECFKILKLNAPSFELHNAAVTAFGTPTVEFRKSDNPENNYRGTVIAGGVHVPSRYVNTAPVKNVRINTLMGLEYDGIKMDIEGSEGPLLDYAPLPRCSKLVLEYHTSRDSSVKNLKRRLAYLKKSFEVVHYPSAYDEVISARVETYAPRFDQLIFCMGAR